MRLLRSWAVPRDAETLAWSAASACPAEGTRAPRRQRRAQSAAQPRPLVLWLEVGEGGGGGQCRQMFPLTQSHDPRPVQGESKTRPLVSTWEVNCPRPGGPSPATSGERQDGGGLARGITRSLEPLHHRRPCSSLSRNRVLGVCGCSAALQTS